jgi:hypothetical protein
MYRSICCRVIIFLSGNHNLIILLWKENLCYPYQNNVILLMCQKGFIKFPREIHNPKRYTHNLSQFSHYCAKHNIQTNIFKNPGKIR